MLLRIGHRIINTNTIVEIDVDDTRAGVTRIVTMALESGLGGTVRPYEIRLKGTDAGPLLEWLNDNSKDLTPLEVWSAK